MPIGMSRCGFLASCAEVETASNPTTSVSKPLVAPPGATPLPFTFAQAEMLFPAINGVTDVIPDPPDPFVGCPKTGTPVPNALSVQLNSNKFVMANGHNGAVQFAITIPENFARDLVRGDRPVLLVEADATDPAATGNAIAALGPSVESALAHDLKGSLAAEKPPASAVDLRIHKRYNPEGITSYNIVPGLLGVILTMTMVLMTGLAMTRERERGTFENLLATPALPVEVMTGKIVPYIMIGLIQVTLVLIAARYIFGVPMEGNLVLLYAAILVFIAANLTLGITFSSIARNQLQAMQMTFFFFLPSILLSGFMFPFRGMPSWAQVIGEVLPLTHFLRLVRGILLKGYGVADSWAHLWPLLLFTAVVLGIGLKRFRRTLD